MSHKVVVISHRDGSKTYFGPFLYEYEANLHIEAVPIFEPTELVPLDEIPTNAEIVAPGDLCSMPH